MTKAEGTGFVVYEFWYKAPPAGFREMLAVEPPDTHPFQYLGLEGLDSCPETLELARRASQRVMR